MAPAHACTAVSKSMLFGDMDGVVNMIEYHEDMLISHQGPSAAWT